MIVNLFRDKRSWKPDYASFMKNVKFNAILNFKFFLSDPVFRFILYNLCKFGCPLSRLFFF